MSNYIFYDIIAKLFCSSYTCTIKECLETKYFKTMVLRYHDIIIVLSNTVVLSQNSKNVLLPNNLYTR